MMLGAAIRDITLGDLTGLIGLVAEDSTLEFKRELRARTRDEVVDFLAAVTSLANTNGGDLIIGADAVEGVLSALPGIAVESVDKEKLRLESLLSTSVEPRLPPVEMKGIEVEDGRVLMVIRVPQSWQAPHRVRTDNRFYRRNSGGRQPMDVAELRSAFVLSETVAERMRSFRSERVRLLDDGVPPVSMVPGPRLIIHLMPLATFASGSHLDIVSMVRNGTVMPLPPTGAGSGNQTFVNLDGMGLMSYGLNGNARAYSQVFRNGVIEGVLSLGLMEGGGSYLVDYFEEIVVLALGNYLRFNADLGLSFPVFIFLSFVGMGDCRIRFTKGMQTGDYSGPLGRDIVELPEVALADASVDMAKALHLSFNTIWNGFGYMASPSYDSAGEWAQRRR